MSDCRRQQTLPWSPLPALRQVVSCNSVNGKRSEDGQPGYGIQARVQTIQRWCLPVLRWQCSLRACSLRAAPWPCAMQNAECKAAVAQTSPHVGACAVQGEFDLSLSADGLLAAALMTGLMLSAPTCSQLSRHFPALRLMGLGLRWEEAGCQVAPPAAFHAHQEGRAGAGRQLLPMFPALEACQLPSVRSFKGCLWLAAQQRQGATAALALLYARKNRLVPLPRSLWVLGAAGCALAPSFAALLACRLLVGAAMGPFIALAAPLIDDQAPPQARLHGSSHLFRGFTLPCAQTPVFSSPSSAQHCLHGVNSLLLTATCGPAPAAAFLPRPTACWPALRLSPGMPAARLCHAPAGEVTLAGCPVSVHPSGLCRRLHLRRRGAMGRGVLRGGSVVDGCCVERLAEGSSLCVGGGRWMPGNPTGTTAPLCSVNPPLPAGGHGLWLACSIWPGSCRHAAAGGCDAACPAGGAAPRQSAVRRQELAAVACIGTSICACLLATRPLVPLPCVCQPGPP